MNLLFEYIDKFSIFLSNIWFISFLELKYNINIHQNFFLFSFIIFIFIYYIHNSNKSLNSFVQTYIWTPLHELTHLIAAIITLSKIEDIKLIASKEERMQGIWWYITTRWPLSLILNNNSNSFVSLLRFILQPIISLSPIIIWGIFYYFIISIILWINYDNPKEIYNSLITLNFSFIEWVFLLVSAYIYSISSIPSVWLKRWDLNNIKIQLLLIFLLSFFIKNDFILYSWKIFLIFTLFTISIQTIWFILWKVLRK